MSLDTVELIVSIERYFKLQMPDSIAETLRTVGDVAAWLGQQLGTTAARNSTVRGAVAAHLQALLPAPPETPVLRLIPDKAAHAEVAARLLESSGLVLPALSFTKRQSPGGWLDILLGKPVPPAELALARYTLADLIDWTVAANYKQLLHSPLESQYDVEQAVIGLTSESSGVAVFDVKLSSSFTDDLGMD